MKQNDLIIKFIIEQLEFIRIKIADEKPDTTKSGMNSIYFSLPDGKVIKVDYLSDGSNEGIYNEIYHNGEDPSVDDEYLDEDDVVISKEFNQIQFTVTLPQTNFQMHAHGVNNKIFATFIDLSGKEGGKPAKEESNLGEFYSYAFKNFDNTGKDRMLVQTEKSIIHPHSEGVVIYDNGAAVEEEILSEICAGMLSLEQGMPSIVRTNKFDPNFKPEDLVGVKPRVFKL